MNKKSTFNHRKLLWEELAPARELRPNLSSNQGSQTGGYSSIAPADENSSRPPKPRLGFARRTTENLEPVLSPEPLSQEDHDDQDFRPRRRRITLPRTAKGWALASIAALILFGAFTSGAIVLRRQILAINRFNLVSANNLQMAGATEVSRAEILPVFNQDLGRNVLQVPLGARRTELEKISWVQRATVMRILPNQLRVSVVERTPVAFVRSSPEDQQIGLVDADGVLLKMPASLVAQRHYSFPVVTGVDAKDSLAERHKRILVYTRLIHELDSGNRKFSEQISEIDLRDPNDARVLMPEAGSDILAHFGADHFLDRYQTYQSHIAEWHQQYPKLTTVDLRYEQQVILRQSDDSSSAAASHPTEKEPVSSSPQTSQNATTTPDAIPDQKRQLTASAIPVEKPESHQNSSQKPSPSKADMAKSEKPAPKSAKDGSASAKPAILLAKSPQTPPKVMDAITSNGSTIHEQSTEASLMKTALPVEKTNSGKAKENSDKSTDKKSVTNGREKKITATKSKKSGAKSKGRQKKATGPKKSNAKPSVKKTSVQTKRSEHPTNQQQQTEN